MLAKRGCRSSIVSRTSPSYEVPSCDRTGSVQGSMGVAGKSDGHVRRYLARPFHLFRRPTTSSRTRRTSPSRPIRGGPPSSPGNISPGINTARRSLKVSSACDVRMRLSHRLEHRQAFNDRALGGLSPQQLRLLGHPRNFVGQVGFVRLRRGKHTSAAHHEARSVRSSGSRTPDFPAPFPSIGEWSKGTPLGRFDGEAPGAGPVVAATGWEIVFQRQRSLLHDEM